MTARITSRKDPSDIVVIENVQHFENYWSTHDNGTEFMKVCTVKETKHINLKEYKIELWQ